MAHLLHPHIDPNAPLIEERYIHNIDDNTRDELVGMNIVGIDPGKKDLLRAVNCPEKLVWRYTQDQRRFDEDSNFYKNQLKIERRQHLVDGQSIEQLESLFGQVTSKKHLSFTLFRIYCYEHNHLVSQVKQFYNQHKHRKRRFQRYRKRQRSEARMLNSFKEKFGDPEVTIVCIGDWSERNHRRFLEPVKGKGFRKLFKKAGYQLFLVDEFRTSKMCSKCEDEEAVCEKFRRVKNPKPRSRIAHPIIRCHGLLRCTTCNTLWDRDILGATNIYKISDMAINGEERPQYLRRQQQQ
jgi:transposase